MTRLISVQRQTGLREAWQRGLHSGDAGAAIPRRLRRASGYTRHSGNGEVTLSTATGIFRAGWVTPIQRSVPCLRLRQPALRKS
jgi:hypothetical protein